MIFLRLRLTHVGILSTIPGFAHCWANSGHFRPYIEGFLGNMFLSCFIFSRLLEGKSKYETYDW